MAYAAGVLIRCGSAVLLLLRNDNADHPRTWGLPGGKIEPGETPVGAAVRETFEEVRYDLSGQPLRVLEDDGHFITYAADLPEPFTPAIDGEHLAYVWADLRELPTPLHPGLAPVLARLTESFAQDEARKYDGNGWFEVKGNPLSKVGVFPYSGRQLGLTDEPEASQMFGVYRPAEELAAPECIESFKLIPWVDNHTMVGPTAQQMGLPGATSAEAKGVGGVVGQDVYFKGDTLYGNIKVFSESLANLIQQGKRELSAGYRCRYDRAAGVFNGQPYDFIQRQIRGNHLATVFRGRMGRDVAVMDQLTFTVDSQEFAMSEEKKEAKDEGAGGGVSTMTLEQLTKMMAEAMPQIAKLTEAVASMTKPKEEAAEVVEDAKDNKPAAGGGEGGEGTPEGATKAEVVAMDEALKAQAKTIDQLRALTDPRVMFKAVQERDALARRLSVVVGTFDHAEMTAEDVAVYGCEKLGLKVDKTAAPAALEGYLKAASERTPSAVAMDEATAPRSAKLLDWASGKARA